MKISKDKICLQCINLLMQVIFTFFSIFFAIYIYGMSQNLNFILGYTIFTAAFFSATEICVVHFLNKKNFNIVYRASFLLVLASIALTFLISSSTIYMVFIVQAVYAVTSVCYYLPQEVATMNYNSKNSMTSYVGVSQILGLVASVLSPIISGFVIDKISYYVLFSIIAALSVICFILSFGVKRGYLEEDKISFKKFFIETHKIKRVKLTYLSYGIYKFSQNSVVDLLLPVLLFLKVGTNFSVGIYSALAAVLGGVTLIVYLLINRKHHGFQKFAFISSTMLLEVVSIMLVAWTSLTSFFIYYFIMTCCKNIISQNFTQYIFTATENTEFWGYKKMHHLTSNLYDHIFKIFAYIVALLIYNFSQTVASITIIILVAALFQIVSTFMLIKADNLYNEEQVAKLKKKQAVE